MAKKSRNFNLRDFLFVGITGESFFQAAIFAPKFIDIGVLNYISLMDENHSRTKRFYFLHDMGGEYHGFFFTYFFNNIPYFDDLVRIQSIGGLIQN